jgi:hypothetical protein
MFSRHPIIVRCVLVQKFSITISFLVTMTAISILSGGHSVVGAKAQEPDKESSSSPTKPNAAVLTNQTNYRAIGGGAWLDPWKEFPVNEPVYITQGTDRYLAVLSIAPMTEAPSSSGLPILRATNWEYKLVTQWSRDKLQVYAYERQDPCKAGRCSGSYSIFINPNPVNQGLFPFAEQRMNCRFGATHCRVISGVPDIQIPRLPTSKILPPQIFAQPVDENGLPVRLPISELPLLPSDEINHRIWIFVGAELFVLDGWQGVFSISSPLQRALSENNLSVTVITPSKWQADIPQQARDNLRLIYQDAASNQGQK